MSGPKNIYEAQDAVVEAQEAFAAANQALLMAQAARTGLAAQMREERMRGEDTAKTQKLFDAAEEFVVEARRRYDEAARATEAASTVRTELANERRETFPTLG